MQTIKIEFTENAFLDTEMEMRQFVEEQDRLDPFELDKLIEKGTFQKWDDCLGEITFTIVD